MAPEMVRPFAMHAKTISDLNEATRVSSFNRIIPIDCIILAVIGLYYTRVHTAHTDR